jgi:natural product precursor
MRLQRSKNLSVGKQLILFIMKNLKEMNSSKIESSKMGMLYGGANGCGCNTITVTYHRATGQTTTADDGADEESSNG